jgi:Xaa-Pro aminopeptidase
MLQEKIDRLQSYCIKNGHDWLLFANFGHELSDAHIYHLLLQNPEHCFVLIPQSGKPIIYTIPFEVAELQARVPECIVYPLDKKFSTAVLEQIPTNSSIGIKSNVFPHLAYTALTEVGYRLVSLEGIEQLVGYKNNSEIESMRKVCALTDDAFSYLIKNWSNFRTEFDVACAFEKFAVIHGASISFPTIVASGAHAAHPHHITSDTALSSGFCVIDMGLRYHGYCSDMTRTIFIGTPDNRELDLYHQIKSVQEKTIHLIAPGVSFSGLDIFCRSELQELNTYFIHGLGHGLGTQVHEWPSVSTKNTRSIESGMVFTIEPGIYKDNEFGIRIEDDILAIDTGYEILTKTSKELYIV